MDAVTYGPTVAYGKPLKHGWIHFLGWYTSQAYAQQYPAMQITVQVACIVHIATVADSPGLTQVVTVNQAFVTVWPEDVLLRAMGVLP